jgi:ABC-type antimicrobial peptide transport system permease subunit
VLTAFLLGTAVGIALATALTVQQNLFTENVGGACEQGPSFELGCQHHLRPLPCAQAFVFVFPAPLFGFTLGACILMACVASYYPTRSLARLPIAGVLKGRTS